MPGAIYAEGLVKTFGEVRALDGVDIDVPEGTVLGLLGPNGAGKTTTVRVLTTLIQPDSGRAEVAGIDVLKNPNEVRRSIGLSGQFAAVDEYLTGRENVEMVGRLYGLSPAASRRRTADVLERIGLIEDAGRRVGTYSGGMRRRLDLAASLVGRPEVMFLDEPTTGIDPRNRLGLWELINDLVAGGTTVLLTTQYLEEADQLADRIGVIHLGRIVSEGTADELKDTLGGAVLELGVEEEHRERAVQTLRDLIGDEPSFDRSGSRLRVPARDGARTVAAAVRALDVLGIEPVDLALHKPTLDDVFLALTGEEVENIPEDDEQPVLVAATPKRRGRRRA
jgi:ABC-2 type transport system ATP-binding protein